MSEPTTAVEIVAFGPWMVDDETGRDWATWFKRHGVDMRGGDRVLVYRAQGDLHGYAMRDVERRRIGWRNVTGDAEYLQLESPPLPFPTARADSWWLP